MKSFPYIFGCMFLFLFVCLFLPLWLYSIDWSGTPELGEAGFRGETYQWNSGTVGICDYSVFPGNYFNRVEWHKNAGDAFRILAEPGDVIPEIHIDESGILTITYQESSINFDSRYNVVVRFRPQETKTDQ